MKSFCIIKRDLLMDIVYNKINKWVPSKLGGTKDGIILSKIYSIFLGVNLKPLIRHFTDRVETVEYKFSESALSSGAVCLFGSIGMSLVQLGYVNNLDELFTFAACYMLTDHYLDDNTISINKKAHTIQQITDFINTDFQNHTDINTLINTIDEPIIQSVAERYVKTVSKIPTAKYHLKESFMSEIKTMYMQRKDNLDRKTYLKNSEWKGGMFCNAIQSIINLPVTDREYQLGVAIQLVDDILDVDDDMELGINTIVTYDLCNDRNLDRIWEYAVDKIDKLDKVYNLFKPVLYLVLIFSVHTNRDKYSDRVVAMSEHFDYLHGDITKGDLISLLGKQIVGNK